MSKRKIVALLPMKAKSERVKNKNFRDFAGKPLFMWMLDTMLSIQEINKVVINTDAENILCDKELHELSRVFVRERKPELRGDRTNMNLIVEDDIKAVPSDLYLMTHTTNPLLSAETIKKAINMFDESTQCDSLFTVNKIQTRFYRKDATPVNHDPNNLIRTQDLEVWYEENSCLFVFTAESFVKTKARIGAHPAMMETPRLESFDIDEPADWIIAESVALYNQYKNGAHFSKQ